MYLALRRAHFNPRYARAKMILSGTKNIFMPANVISIVILKNTLGYYSPTTGDVLFMIFGKKQLSFRTLSLKIFLVLLT